MTGGFVHALSNVERLRAGTVNLIASENRMSPCVRHLLSMDSASRYFFEGTEPPAFPGGAAYAEAQHYGEQLLGRLGRARYVNMRPLSGLHAMTVLISALTNAGDTVVSLSPDSGGHYATGPMTTRLGRRHGSFRLTADQDLDEAQIERSLARCRPRLLYIDQCHGLLPVPVKRIVQIARAAVPSALVHADMSHGLGLVLGGVLDNPLNVGCHSFGGSTHKTFPGPQKGVLLTNDGDLARRIADAQYDLISNHHLGTALSLSAALWEFSEFGGEIYAASVPAAANDLGRALSQRGIAPVRIGRCYSGWHQLWIPPGSLPRDASTCAARLARAGVMVNLLPDLPGLGPSAIRIGVSEICHLGFSTEDTTRLAGLISDIVDTDVPAESFRAKTTDLLDSVTCPYDYRPEEQFLAELSDTNGADALCLPWSPITRRSATSVFVSGRGARVSDHRGRTWLDAKSGSLNATLGYGRTDIADRAREQLVRLMSSDAVGTPSAPALALARRIAALTGEALPHTLFCGSGSEATEAALKIALLFHQLSGQPQRRRVVSFEHGYHGCTMGALALSQLAFPKVGLDWLPQGLAVPMVMPQDDRGLSELQATLDGDESATIAAVILEPVQGIGGIRPFPDRYLAELRLLCDRTEVLLIMDEVLTGFGRTGRMFAYQHGIAIPDILLTSKGLTSGYIPLSAVSMSARVYRGLSKDPHLGGLRHGHTTSAHATACAVALRVLDILESEDLVGRAERVGTRLLDELVTLTELPGVVDVRGRGLMLGIEFASAEDAGRVVEACYNLGLLLRAHETVVQILPPLTISDDDAVRVAAMTREAVCGVVGRPA